MSGLVRLVQFSAIFLILILAGGCCRPSESTPTAPSSVRGWHEYDEEGIHGVGEFLLKKGESVENGKIGVELVKTTAAIKCYEPFSERDLYPTAIVRFYAIPGKETLVELEVRKKTSNALKAPVSNYGVNAIFVRDINTKDGWLWFELWQ